MKIINKISIDKQSIVIEKSSKETKLFDTEIENYIILNLNVKENEQGKIFK